VQIAKEKKIEGTFFPFSYFYCIIMLYLYRSQVLGLRFQVLDSEY
jgi:hypothetical protein